MKKFLRFLSYVLVAAVVYAGTSAYYFLNFEPVTQLPNTGEAQYTKLDQLQDLIEERFIGETDTTVMEDGAAAGMVAALGDEWSYYISAAEYAGYLEQVQNAYVGVGITITVREDGYLDIMKVEKGGPAWEAGILPGDVMIRAAGEDCAELGIEETSALVKGEEGTFVDLTIRRADEEIEFHVERRYIQVAVAEYQMLDGGIGLIQIKNFDDRCADETLSAIKTLRAEGATALIFDVRNNPGGYKHELVEILDYLLPEGVLFRSEHYDGSTEEDTSDAKFLDMPMAVLVNEESYSAAEFFAAAMHEYEAAFTVGTQTYGKGYYQQTFQLMDGSAVGLSVGKYYTPKGVSLAGVGITPDVVVDVDDEQFIKIYSGMMPAEEDPQILAAVEALKSSN